MALNNLQRLTCHKTQKPTNQPNNQPTGCVVNDKGSITGTFTVSAKMRERRYFKKSQSVNQLVTGRGQETT